MVAERRLFERLKHAGKQDERSLRIDTKVMTDSVLEHLRKMLNVRQGSVPACPDYGLPDFNDIFAQFQNATLKIQEEIKRCIGDYEPRLDRESLHIEDLTDKDTPYNLRFEIIAKLITGAGEAPLRFETSLEPIGRVRIEDRTVGI